jgi:hypothetical protein
MLINLQQHSLGSNGHLNHLLSTMASNLLLVKIEVNSGTVILCLSAGLVSQTVVHVPTLFIGRTPSNEAKESPMSLL